MHVHLYFLDSLLCAALFRVLFLPVLRLSHQHAACCCPIRLLVPACLFTCDYHTQLLQLKELVTASGP